jgi:hypothetical protein
VIDFLSFVCIAAPSTHATTILLFMQSHSLASFPPAVRAEDLVKGAD